MFRHIGIVVCDIEKQLLFYNKLLGLEIMSHEQECGIFLNTILGINDVNIDIYKLGSDGETIVELLLYKDFDSNIKEKKINQNGLTHFAITVKDLENLYKHLKDNNVSLLSSPCTNEKKTHKVCFCRDFENNLIELVEEL
jgi:catechol-2,3-dioxygenase